MRVVTAGHWEIDVHVETAEHEVTAGLALATDSTALVAAHCRQSERHLNGGKFPPR